MNTILVVHQGAVGDFILSLPAIEAIHRTYPEAAIHLLSRPEYGALIAGRPYTGRVYDCDGGAWASLYLDGADPPQRTRDLLPRVEQIYVFGGGASATMTQNLSKLLGAPSLRIRPFPPPERPEPVAVHQCRQLQERGIAALPPPAPVIAPGESAHLEVETYLDAAIASDKPLILAHPGSGSRSKIWSLHGWLNVLERLVALAKVNLVLIQGPADDEPVGWLQRRLPPGSFQVVRTWPLSRIAALCRRASLYVGHDSGITHLAAACGLATIALFGPTDPRIWAPMGAKVEVVRWRAPADAAPPPAEKRQILVAAGKFLRGLSGTEAGANCQGRRLGTKPLSNQ